MHQRRQLAALDVAIVLAYVGGDDAIVKVITRLRAKGFFCVITDVIRRELLGLLDSKSGSEEAVLVDKFFSEFDGTQIHQLKLPSLETAIADRLAQKLNDKFLVGASSWDSLAIAEAAMSNCFIFLTTSESILNADFEQITLAIRDSDIQPVAPICAYQMLDLMDKLGW